MVDGPVKSSLDINSRRQSRCTVRNAAGILDLSVRHLALHSFGSADTKTDTKGQIEGARGDGNPGTSARMEARDRC